jgi:phosphoribosylamine--glycine ligase
VGAAPGTASGVLPVFPGAAVGIVLASRGYPGNPKVGQGIRGLDEAEQEALVFHGGSIARPGGGYGTKGGRVLTVVGRGPDLPTAREAAERGADHLSWAGLQRRRDIAALLPPAPAERVEAASSRRDSSTCSASSSQSRGRRPAAGAFPRMR